METGISVIPSTFQVIYTTYALFPAAADIGTLAYATDLGILYRWSGAAWQAITAAGAYHELIPGAAHETVSHIAWEAWDISAIVPAGATLADIMVLVGAGITVGVRETGSALERKVAAVAGQWFTWRVPLTGTRIIELWDSDNLGAGSLFHVIGYWA